MIPFLRATTWSVVDAGIHLCEACCMFEKHQRKSWQCLTWSLRKIPMPVMQVFEAWKVANPCYRISPKLMLEPCQRRFGMEVLQKEVHKKGGNLMQRNCILKEYSSGLSEIPYVMPWKREQKNSRVIENSSPKTRKAYINWGGIFCIVLVIVMFDRATLSSNSVVCHNKRSKSACANIPHLCPIGWTMPCHQQRTRATVKNRATNHITLKLLTKTLWRHATSPYMSPQDLQNLEGMVGWLLTLWAKKTFGIKVRPSKRRSVAYLKRCKQVKWTTNGNRAKVPSRRPTLQNQTPHLRRWFSMASTTKSPNKRIHGLESKSVKLAAAIPGCILRGLIWSLAVKMKGWWGKRVVTTPIEIGFLCIYSRAKGSYFKCRMNCPCSRSHEGDFS